MILPSFFLSLFFSVFLFLEIWTFRRFNFDVLRVGREVSVSRQAMILASLGMAVICMVFSYLALTVAGPEFLQTFYIALFSVSFLVLVFFLLPVVSRLRYRALAALLISFLALWLVLEFPGEFLQNLFMAAALLWVGPFIFRRWRISLKFFLIFILAFTAFDVYNIYFSGQPTIFSDEFFFLNGLVKMGEFELGIGDFIFAYLSVAAALTYFRKSAAVSLAILLPLPRFFIRILFPGLAGAVFPYTIFMAPLVLLVFIYGYWEQKAKVIKSLAG